MLPIATFIDLGAKPGLPRFPEGGVTDEKKHLKCLMEKSPPPYGVIERTNRLQDCQNGVQWCQKSLRNVSETCTKRQPRRFKNHHSFHHYCFNFADSLYRFICRATRSIFTHSIHSFNGWPNFKQNVFRCCTCKQANTLLQVGGLPLRYIYIYVYIYIYIVHTRTQIICI